MYQVNISLKIRIVPRNTPPRMDNIACVYLEFESPSSINTNSFSVDSISQRFEKKVNLTGDKSLPYYEEETKVFNPFLNHVRFACN